MRYIFLGKRVRLSVFLPATLYFWTVFAGPEAALQSFSAVVLHECGHIFAGLVTGRKISVVTLSPFGADIGYTGASSYKTDVLTALAGPFVSVISGILFYKAFYGFAVISFIYGLLNLIPVPCFDGGRTLRCILRSSADIVKADLICDAVSVLFLIIMYVFSVFLLFYTSFNASLLFICAYVFTESYVKMK